MGPSTEMGGTLSRMVDVLEIWEGEAGSGMQVNTTQGFEFSLFKFI